MDRPVHGAKAHIAHHGAKSLTGNTFGTRFPDGAQRFPQAIGIDQSMGFDDRSRLGFH
jgi:hypothetical protein